MIMPENKTQKVTVPLLLDMKRKGAKITALTAYDFPTAKIVDGATAQSAPFCITGEYSRWKQVVKKELDPVKGMMQGKLKLKGSLPTIVRFVKASQELVNSASDVDTKFLDD